MSEWKPIATVPRDGTLVLLYQPNMPIEIARWDRYTEQWWEQTSATTKELQSREAGHWEGADDIYDPTHWMPLPKAPDA